MAKFARIIDGVVSDFIAPLEGFTIEQCFHPDILAMYIQVDDEVQAGWVVTEDGIVDPNAPEPEPEPEVPAEEEAPVEEAPVEEAPVEEAPADTPPAA